MKFYHYIFALMLLTGCADQKEQQNTGLWTFDVTKEYPTKEMYIQDIADVEYIPLETNDSMLWLGRELEFFDDDYIIAANIRTGVLVHNREGKALHSFHHIGGGPEEYRGLYCADYDKEKDEIYILSYVECKFYVFDGKGNYKRSFSTGHGLANPVGAFFLCGNEIVAYSRENTYVRMSKQTGEIIERFTFGSDSKYGLSYTQNGNKVTAPPINYFIKDKDGYILSAFASDTTWLLTPEKTLKPIGVRIPPVTTMEVPIFLLPIKNTPDFYFMCTIKRATKFPMEMYMLDKKENQIYRLPSKLKNKDCVDQEVHLDMAGPISGANIPVNMSIQSLNTSKLINAYEDGRLSGKLKDIAANLKEDDNPVLMVIKFRDKEQ